MITENTFTKDWLLAVNENLGWNRQETQLKNLEKAIVALALLELLADAKLNFIFKGGTSLLLLLQKIYRLSIDIDIIFPNPLNDAENVFAHMCSKSTLFTHFARQERDSDALLDTEHYKFFYKPFADEVESSYIILDLYRSANPYSKTLKLELDSSILETQGKNETVHVPDVDSILADKLTAFAPDTIGISLSATQGHRPKRIEILKQLFDIGNLFDVAENVEHIRQTYTNIAWQEIERRRLNITPTHVLRDSERHVYIIGHAGKVEKPIYEKIAKGYKDFKKFVADLSFDENQAILSAAKTAYLISALHCGGKTLEKYNPEFDMEPWSINDKSCLDLNEYKYGNPEAFFYWYKALMTKSV